MNKKVSIIIPCYNQGRYVAEAIQSALDQTYSNTEIVCINDASTDNTRDVIAKLSEEHKDKIVFIENLENKGVIYSRNRAIDTCSGEYILPLDADNMIKPTYVEKAAKMLEENPKVGVVYCRVERFGKNKGEWALGRFDTDMLFCNCVENCSMFRKTDFLAVGQYKQYMKNGLEDWDLWLGFMEKGFSFYKIDEILLLYRTYKEESRSEQARKHVRELYLNIVRNHPQLYLNNDDCILNIFRVNYEPKYRKYKKLWILFLVLTILELILLIVVLKRGL